MQLRFITTSSQNQRILQNYIFFITNSYNICYLNKLAFNLQLSAPFHDTTVVPLATSFVLPIPLSSLVYHRTRRTEVHKHLIPNSPSNFRQSQHALNTCRRCSLSTETWRQPLPKDEFTVGICQDRCTISCERKLLGWPVSVFSKYGESCCGCQPVFLMGFPQRMLAGTRHSFLHSPVKWE